MAYVNFDRSFFIFLYFVEEHVVSYDSFFYKNNIIRTSSVKFGQKFFQKTIKNLKFDYG